MFKDFLHQLQKHQQHNKNNKKHERKDKKRNKQKTIMSKSETFSYIIKVILIFSCLCQQCNPIKPITIYIFSVWIHVSFQNVSFTSKLST